MEAAFDAPVIVVGGGPVGYALALGLAHHGVASILLERSTGVHTESRALGVWGRTLEILRDWGAGDALCAAGTYYTAASIHDAASGQPLLSIDFTSISDVYENPGALILPQSETERILRERTAATGLCDVRAAWEVTLLREDESGVEVRASSPEGDRTLRAAYVAGCDGAAGMSRASLGMSLDGTAYGVSAVIADERVEDDDPESPFFRIAAKSPGLLLGIRFAPKTWRVVASVPAQTPAADALSEAAHAARIRALFGRPAAATTLRKELFALERRRARRFVVGRVALAGDAAHLASPAGGEGMNAGIQDAANLAWKLAYAVTGRGDPRRLLRSYDDERQQTVAELVEARSDKLVKFTMQTPLWIKKLSVGIFARMLRERGMQRKTARALGMLSGRYTKSPLVDARHPLAGRRIDDLVLPNGSRINRTRGGKAALIAVGDVALDGLPAIRLPVAPKRWTVKPPVALVVRPDGIVAAVVEKPTRARIESAWERAFAGERIGNNSEGPRKHPS
ncbi:MAG TPA: FAD-dependent monooxygenase [Verrucomicrobiae bacterium]|nr:FAD-dependent monooxygenase [Verrucomicrobiae bacterium]